MAPHSSTLACKIPWTEEPGRMQSMGSQRVGHDWATSLSLFTSMHWRRKWQPTPVVLPGESHGWGKIPWTGSLVGCHLWGRTESDTTEGLSSNSSSAQTSGRINWNPWGPAHTSLILCIRNVSFSSHFTMHFSCHTDISFRGKKSQCTFGGFRWLLHFINWQCMNWMKQPVFVWGRVIIEWGVNLDWGGIEFFKTIPRDFRGIWCFDSRRIYVPSSPFLPSDLANVWPYQMLVCAILLHLHPVAAAKCFEADFT